MSDPDSDRSKIGKIRDPVLPTPDLPDPRTASEERKWDQGSKGPSPTQRLDIVNQERIHNLKALNYRHLADCEILRNRLEDCQTQWSDLRVEHAILKSDHANL